jgi:hypothetical protein
MSKVRGMGVQHRELRVARTLVGLEGGAAPQDQHRSV